VGLLMNCPQIVTIERVYEGDADETAHRAESGSLSSDGVGDESAPCPWCGGAGKLHLGTAVRTKSPRCLIWVVCGNSDCRASLGLGEWTEGKAIAKWNRRAKGVSSPNAKGEAQPPAKKL